METYALPHFPGLTPTLCHISPGYKHAAPSPSTRYHHHFCCRAVLSGFSSSSSFQNFSVSVSDFTSKFISLPPLPGIQCYSAFLPRPSHTSLFICGRHDPGWQGFLSLVLGSCWLLLFPKSIESILPYLLKPALMPRLTNLTTVTTSPFPLVLTTGLLPCRYSWMLPQRSLSYLAALRPQCSLHIPHLFCFFGHMEGEHFFFFLPSEPVGYTDKLNIPRNFAGCWVQLAPNVSSVCMTYIELLVLIINEDRHMWRPNLLPNSPIFFQSHSYLQSAPHTSSKCQICATFPTNFCRVNWLMIFKFLIIALHPHKGTE